MRRRNIQWITRTVDLGFGLGPSEETAPEHYPALSPIDEAVFFLHTAAEIEQALMAQYLFAYWSLPPGMANDWAVTIREIAVQEMGHLLTVQNVLRALGGPLNLEREDYPFRGEYYPFRFRLEPLSLKSLAKYVLAEMPDSAEFDELEEIQALAAEDQGAQPVNRVGALFNSLFLLVQKLDDGHFKRPRNDTFSFQGDAEHWAGASVGGPVFPGMLVDTVDSRQSALDALAAIAEQGEGAAPGADSHFDRLLRIYREMKAAGIDGPVRDLVSDPNTAPGPWDDPELEAGRLTDPVAEAWANLFDHRYRMLLYNLTHVLHLGAEEDASGNTRRSELRNWTFQEMFNLSAIARLLMGMPAKPGGTRLAGPCFQMPHTLALADGETDRWYGHCNLLDTSAALIAKVREADSDAGRMGTLDAIASGDVGRRAMVSARVDELQGTRPAAEDTCRRAAEVPVQIREIAVFPPLAIGRFGSAASAMDNYEAVETTATGHRLLRPAETLEVDPASGEISRAFVPNAVRFREGTLGPIRPVAPFLEVWARFTEGGPFEPLTAKHVSSGSVRWRVRAGNYKLSRRTGDVNDRIRADTGFFSEHDGMPLVGQCTNFLPGKSVRFGSVRYIRPNEDFPEIRLRFTPPPGLVFGPRAGDPNTQDQVYDASRGRWDNHNDGSPTLPPGTPQSTIPVQIYARDQVTEENLGYLDDSCDAIVEVEVTQDGATHRAFGRVTTGPPDFAPDSFHVRTLADDFEQMALGAAVTGEVDADTVIELVRRALETIRLMNSDFLNQSVFPDFPPAQAAHGRILGLHTGILQALQGLRSPAGSPERLGAVGALRSVLARLRTFEQTTSTAPAARQAMPALMRGSDGGRLALTRRQRSMIERAIEQFDAPPDTGGTPEGDMLNLVSSLMANAGLHAGILDDDARPLSERFADPPAMLAYLRSATIRGFLAPASLRGQPLVVPGNPDASAFVELLNTPGHPMRTIFAQIDAASGKTRLQVVRDWIASLAT
jgi:hypothetical protein